MTEAHTLRGLAGLDPTPCALADSALVMIDCQNTYRSGVMTLAKQETGCQDIGCGTGVTRVSHLLRRVGSLGLNQEKLVGNPICVNALLLPA